MESGTLELATDLIEAALSVQTMVSKRDPARVNTMTHQPDFSILSPSLSPPLFPSPDLTYPDLYCANFDCASRPGGPTCFGQPIVVVTDFLEMLPKQDSVVVSRKSLAERDVHCAIG